MVKFTTEPPVRARGCKLYLYTACIESNLPYEATLVTAPDGARLVCGSNKKCTVIWKPTEAGIFYFSIKVVCGSVVEHQKWQVEVNDACDECPEDCWVECDELEAAINSVTELIPTEEEICHLIQPKIDAAVDAALVSANAYTDSKFSEALNYINTKFDEFCQKLNDLRDEFQTFIDDCCGGTTEPPTECTTTLSSQTPNPLVLDDDGTGCLSEITTVTWNGCSIGTQGMMSMGILTAENALFVATEAGTYDISILTDTLTTTGGYASVALTLLTDSVYQSIVDSGGSGNTTDTGCSILDLWASMIGTIAQTGTDPCAGSNVAMPSSVTLGVGDRVYISGVTDQEASDINLDVSVCLTKQS